MSGEDDRELIEACRNGRVEAFGRLVMRYKDRLYPTLLRLTGNAEDALDLIQDTFLRAYQKIDGFHGESSFYTWIYRIAVNLALSERRKRKPPIRLSDVPAFDPADAADDPGRSDPSSRLERQERERLVQKALDQLPPDFRTVVVLKDLEGLRYETIAEVLNVPVGTVRSRLHRGRADLRSRLSALLDEGEAAPLPLEGASTRGQDKEGRLKPHDPDFP